MRSCAVQTGAPKGSEFRGSRFNVELASRAWRIGQLPVERFAVPERAAQNCGHAGTVGSGSVFSGSSLHRFG